MWAENQIDPSGSIEDYKPRRVVAGVGSNGVGTVLEDAISRCYDKSAIANIHELLRVESLPATFEPSEIVAESVDLNPPVEGCAVRIVKMAPDSEWKGKEDPFGEAFANLHDKEQYTPVVEKPGMHTTDTIDVITVISGEVTSVLEDQDVILKPGDTLLQLGSKHAWSNQGTEPATFIVFMIAASR